MSPGAEGPTRESRVGVIVYRILLGGVAAVACGVAAVMAATGGGGAGPASTAEWTAGTSSPNPGRTEVGAARIDDQIYVVGGFQPAGMSGAVTDWVRRYDISEDEWRDTCVAEDDPPGCIAPMPTKVNHPAVTSYGGRLYVHGGWTSNGLTQPTNKLQRYNPETKNWKQLTPTVNPRAAHTIEGLNGRLYAVGGVKSSSYGVPPSASMSIYNIAKDQWKSGPRMSVAREHLTGVALDGRIFVIAGRRLPGNVNLDAFERYNPATGSWKTLPDLQVPRSGIASGTAHGKIVVFGGEELGAGGQTIEEVETYDQPSQEWDFLPPMLIPRHGHGGASYQGIVYALEGGPTPGFSYTSSVEYLDVPE